MRKFAVLFFTVFLLGGGGKKSVIILMPGFYQLKQGRVFKGTVLAGTFFALGAAALVENQRGYQYYDLYKKATTRDDAVFYREKTENSFRRRNIYILGAVLVWTVHILDIKISSGKRAKIRGKIEKNSASLGFAYSF